MSKHDDESAQTEGNPDNLTITFVEDGVVKVKEISKHIWHSGPWATALFLYQEWDASSQEYRSPKVALRRYRKRGHALILDSKFVFSSLEQAQEIAAAIQKWASPSTHEAANQKMTE